MTNPSSNPVLPDKRGDTEAGTAPGRQGAYPAPLWRRIAALVYDVFPLIGLWMVTAFVCLFAFGRHYDPAHPDWATRLGLQLALLAVTVAYFMISWVRIGRTIGMRAWKLKLLREDGGKVGLLTAPARFFLALLSLGVAGIGFWWALFDAQNRTLHDRICKTVMVRMD
ncbi:MAG TPA: RDD family protein [Rhodanobacteraceae bacterium]